MWLWQQKTGDNVNIQQRRLGPYIMMDGSILCDYGVTVELPRWLSGEEFSCNAGDGGLIPGLERSPGERNYNPLQYSCLKNSMDRGAWYSTKGHKEPDKTDLLSIHTRGSSAALLALPWDNEEGKTRCRRMCSTRCHSWKGGKAWVFTLVSVWITSVRRHQALLILGEEIKAWEQDENTFFSP